MKKKKIETFIVGLWANILAVLGFISPFRIIVSIFPFAFGDGITEIWVIGNLFASVVLLHVSSACNITWWEIVILIYAGIRILEIIINQFIILLFGFILGGYKRIVILVINNALEIIIWFAIFYRNFDYLFQSKYIQLNTFLGSIYYSIVTMSTLGYGDIIPKNHYALYIIIPQMLIGIFIAIVILTKFISFLPKPGTFDKSEKNKKSD